MARTVKSGLNKDNPKTKKLKFNEIFPVGTFRLVGGRTRFEGNVLALNPDTGIFGPVCNRGFDLKAVKLSLRH